MLHGDNAFVESLFRTAKYRPEFPEKGFAGLGGVRELARKFVHGYNRDHRHSGIRYVSPAQRHDGVDVAILAARYDVYGKARQRSPGRRSGDARDWSHVTVVTLNPERESLVTAASRSMNTRTLAA
ncbi:integrase core domain-containing protein [Roseateles sp. SL47]|uniref:integrase core domain-containing protein n=1 Tax=Roseateles sp. SL47 TaxID=2995138 RepID=UPI002271D5D3|nr:integrase core domain-containing protein [Roseateles sp. SL47]WAC70968.1 integrase core domain-containing protein [Roseateles sp. SL47]